MDPAIVMTDLFSVGCLHSFDFAVVVRLDVASLSQVSVLLRERNGSVKG